MKRIVIALAFVCPPLFAQTTTITFTPANPKPGDTVKVNVVGSTGGNFLINPPNVSISANTIAIVASCSSVLAGTAIPFNLTTTFTAPAAGLYDVEFDYCGRNSVWATRQLVVANGCDFGHALTVDPTAVNVGDAVTLNWCDPSFFLTDSGYYVNSYRIYSAHSVMGPFTPVADISGSTNTQAQVHPDAGTAFYYVESHGCQGAIIFCSMASDTTMLSNIIAVNAARGPCFQDPTTLCLLNANYSVRARWRTPDGRVGDGRAVSLTADSGYFWFFDSDNAEVTVKLLNGCATTSPAVWFFAAGMTNVQVDLTVRNTFTGATKTYSNAQGNPFTPILDTNAFRCP